MKYLAMLGILLCLTACSDPLIYQKEIESANKVCEVNGGLRHMEPWFGDVFVRCNNSARFSVKRSKE